MLVDQVKFGLQPQNSSVAMWVVEYLCENGPTSRVNLVQAFNSHWQQLGGVPVTTDVTSKIKKVLANLVDGNELEAIGGGYYRVSDDESQLIVKAVVPPSEGEYEFFGEGSDIVYGFTLPHYKETDTYPVKIGYTSGILRTRMSAHSTACPEVPEVLFAIRTDDGASLEKLIHGILDFRGSRLLNSGGSEWFQTNTEEVLGIYGFLSKKR